MNLRHVWILPLLCLIACQPTGTGPKSTASPPIEGCPERLRFAVTDIPGAERLEKEFGTFQTALGDVLGIPIELFPVSSHVAATPALMFDRVDLALAGPSEYVLMNAKADAIPLVGITRPGYYTVILTSAESNIDSLEALRGKTLGIREEGSTAGHLGALQLLMETGLQPITDFEIEIIGDDSGLLELKAGRLDAWADASTRYLRVLEENQLSEADFSAIAQGEQLPNDIVVANPSLDEACIEGVRSRLIENEKNLMGAILASPANSKYQESKLVPARDEDYDMIREGYKAIGEEDYL